MTAGQKAAFTRKWRRAAQRAHRSGQNAKTFTKYFLAKKGYKSLSLDSRKGYEYKGVVDLIAVKRDKKNPDILRLILFQVKGGEARVSAGEIHRLQQAARRIRVGWNIAEKPSRSVKFRKRVR
jgi:hypothetical protein